MANGGSGSQEIARHTIEVAHSADVSRARQMAGSVAKELGFDASGIEDVALVSSELASNVVKHAGHGTLTFIPLRDPAGIEIESSDTGPGIPDLARAMADGFSTTGSLGYGLGTVNRLMDDLEFATPPGGRGLRLVCRRWVRRNGASAEPLPLAFGVATRPHPLMMVNGDTFVVKRWGTSALVGIIDGLGHGPAAHLAAETARQYVESHYVQPLDALFRGTARACASTRGVVMALARLDCDLSKLTFASVGNVEVRVFGAEQSMGFLVRRGVVGHNAPQAVVTEHFWQPSYLMVLHSDGVRTHWRREDFPDLWSQPAEHIARELLKSLAKNEDDATVIVVRAKLT